MKKGMSQTGFCLHQFNTWKSPGSAFGRFSSLYTGGHTLKSYRHEAKKWVGGLEANFHKRSLCVKFSHNTCTAL